MPKVTGLEGVIAAETAISLVDGEKGQLVYRGQNAAELAIEQSFEEVAYLLWYGERPTTEEVEALKLLLKQKRPLPNHLVKLLKELPTNMEMMSVIRTVISALGNETYGWKPTIQQAIELTALIPTIIAYRYRLLKGVPVIEPNDDLDYVANYVYMLKGEIPQNAQLKALEGYFILTMEHGMNASTFAARVVASTESDLVSAVCGAIGAMKGPLHGGAPSGVIDMLNHIHQTGDAHKWIREALEKGERLMGFGHRVYKTYDPRSVALKTITEQVAGEDEWLDLAYHVEQTAIALLDEYKPGRRLYTNVEFYVAAVLRAVNLPPQLFTPTFTASRVVGWTAHVLEQAENNRIFRPQSVYVGK